MAEFRTESDSMGEMQVSADAYYGAQTARAVENFPISGLRMPRAFIRAMGIVKQCAARVNGELKILTETEADLIQKAAAEVIDGKLDGEFVVDVFQTGSGTSTNMNTNEVVASRANELVGEARGGKRPIHPNDHVNRGQSSNDVIPTAIHVSGMELLVKSLTPALEYLHSALMAKAAEFDSVLKIGRTHLQDAVPVRLGQEFSGYAGQVAHALQRVKAAEARLSQLAIGGTAIGTGLNTHPEFPERMVAAISEVTGVTFNVADNHFEALASRDAVVRNERSTQSRGRQPRQNRQRHSLAFERASLRAW